MFQSIINSILKWESAQIVFVQNVFQPAEQYLEILSHVTSARFMEMYLFPLLLIFSARQYVNVTISATVSHISVICLKWILRGPRPYWWINETELYTEDTKPEIQQTYLTCETSPGNPSGHTMVTSSVLFIMFSLLLENYRTYQRRFSQTIEIVAWAVFGLILGGTTISRLYFGCHFFHQCFLGICCGVTCSQLIRNPSLNKFLMEMDKIKAFIIAFVFAIAMLAVYYSHFVFGVDPQWSILKAFNWCTDAYSIRPESTPVYALCREFAILFGLTLCAPFQKRIDTELSVKWSLPTVLAASGLNWYVTSLVPRYNGALVFFVSTAAVNFTFAFVLLRLVVKMAGKPIKID